MSNSENKWQHPKQLLKLQKLKLKKQALQTRINGNRSLQEQDITSQSCSSKAAFENVLNCKKRKNPFLKEDGTIKKSRNSDFLSESEDPTLFKLFNQCETNLTDTSVNSFSDILTRATDNVGDNVSDKVESKFEGCEWCPTDWSLKKKLRLISLRPFAWSQKLKISEEASGITSFTRCLDIDKSDTSLDTSPNAKFHQCCLYWQQPSIPWLTLFPRSSLKNSTNGVNLATSASIKNSLFQAWTDSLKSLYQLIRTRQCPYFYVCANSFTALFRAAGLFGHIDLHVMVTPTTRGFRHLLKEEDIEFELPLKSFQSLNSSEENEFESKQNDATIEDKCLEELNDTVEEDWLKTLGINADDIKNINYTQARLKHKTECLVDSSEQSLVLIEGVDVNSFFNFLINCKSAISSTGPLAGVPPTLLSPVSFQGATLNSLRVRESKVQSDGIDYYSLELTGPILPSTVHNIFNISNPDHSITVTFNDIENTRGFSKVRNSRKSLDQRGSAIFGKANLSDCGLNPKILKHFCSADRKAVSNIECLKYSGDSQTFTWT